MGSGSHPSYRDAWLRDLRSLADIHRAREAVLRDLQLGPYSVNLCVHRHGEEVSLEVLRTRGQIQVSIIFEGRHKVDRISPRCRHCYAPRRLRRRNSTYCPQ